MKHYKFQIAKISLSDETINFDPPILIEVTKEGEIFYFDFDFGLNIGVSLDDFYLTPKDNWQTRAEKKIQFELEHAFFHYYKDSNYSLLNWALYGNLKDRVVIS